MDLGCGPGFCTFALSHLVGSNGHIFAVDSSDKFASLLQEKIKVNNTQNISFHKNNANNLSLEDSSADAVFARWLFCFLENPSQVLAEIKRVLKPKGRLIIIDYFNYRAANIFPNNDALSELFKAYLQIVTAHKRKLQYRRNTSRIDCRKRFRDRIANANLPHRPPEYENLEMG